MQLIVENNVTGRDSSVKEESLALIRRDALKYAPGKIIGMLANMALVPIYTNILAPEQYGLYMIATAVISFIAVIFSDWIGLSVLRFFQVHYQHSNVRDFFSTTLFLIFSNLALMYVFSFIFFDKLKDFFRIPENYLFMVLLLLVPIAFRALLFQLLRAQLKPMYYTVYAVANQIATAIIAIYLIKTFNMGAEGILIGMGISIAVTDVFMLFTAKLASDSEIKITKLIKPDILIGLYKYGIPIAASSFGMWMLTQSDKFVLQHFKGSFYNGLAGVGYNLTFSLLFPLFSVIILATVPRVIKHYECGNDIRELIPDVLKYYIYLFAPVVLIICLFPKEIVLLLSNKKYLNAQILLPFLAISAFVYGFAEYTVIKYYIAKKTYIDTIIKIVPNGLAILMNIILLSVFQGKYALFIVGISALSAQILYLLLSLVIRIQEFEWQIPYYTIRRCALALLAGSAVGLPIHFLASVSITGIFYIKVLVVVSAYILSLKFLPQRFSRQ